MPPRRSPQGGNPYPSPVGTRRRCPPESATGFEFQYERPTGLKGFFAFLAAPPTESTTTSPLSTDSQAVLARWWYHLPTVPTTDAFGKGRHFKVKVVSLSRLQRAKRYFGDAIRSTALTIIPLAALAITPALDAATVISINSGSFQQLGLGINGVNGVKLFGSASCSSCNFLQISWAGTVSGFTGSPLEIPLLYEFSAGNGSGGFPFSGRWELNDTLQSGQSGPYVFSFGTSGALSGFQLITGSGTATISGNGNFSLTLIINDPRERFENLEIQVPTNSIDVNGGIALQGQGSAVPEPSTLALVTIAGVGLCVARLRRRTSTPKE
jgi:hypothetical protein